MTARRLLTTLAIAVAAALASSSATAAAQLTIGMGDEQTEMFTDPLLKRLRLNQARLVTGWDTALQAGSQRDDADAYLAAARRAGYQVLVSFAHSGNAGRTRTLPSPAAYQKGVRAFIKRYPQVRMYSPWDEVNTCSEPTCHSPKMAATYYRTLQRACRGCTVIAAEVLDTDYTQMRSYLRQFIRYAGKPTPQLWALHPYSDANRFRTIGTRTMLQTVPGTVWFTEVGGLYSYPPSFPPSSARQVRAVKQMQKLATSSPRIKRLYYYSWQGGGTFDAGLMAPTGSPRPAYTTFAAWVARQRGR
ncbi:hypothetical protein Q5424_14990 [Conexibacter sp. JD483]|uniref:glycosyl hydrolase n=1 Tax=unclassified Conexibacter TaxID=2627773 RepID=UPI002726F1F9|nr:MULTISPECIES: glycosyl hydrolase [unclassified Conexibacter]MDO8187981.1 hypothetical protein [Conexibacter sp. CPCC 205706]MDO8200864.1 hypothetical protein [Conexibacter sp. CPCC 205762]MDR9370403.1 hypothetical protein [Conexibacter sp. JD483]